MLIYQYNTICAAFVHICHWCIQCSTIAFFSVPLFSRSVSLMATKSICQYYPLCAVLAIVLLSENLAVGLTTNNWDCLLTFSQRWGSTYCFKTEEDLPGTVGSPKKLSVGWEPGQSRRMCGMFFIHQVLPQPRRDGLRFKDRLRNSQGLIYECTWDNRVVKGWVARRELEYEDTTRGAGLRLQSNQFFFYCRFFYYMPQSTALPRCMQIS